MFSTKFNKIAGLLSFSLIFFTCFLHCSGSVSNNHIIYDNIGSLATRVSHVHVAIPLNITAIAHQLTLFSDYLSPLVADSPLPRGATKSQIETNNFQKIISSTAIFSFVKIDRLREQLHFISSILPQDDKLDVHSPRHKRFLSIIPALILSHQFKANFANKAKEADYLRRAENKIRLLQDQIYSFKNPIVQPLPDLMIHNLFPNSSFSGNSSFTPTFRHSTNDTLARNKRQILAAAAVVSGLAGTFFGLFTHFELQAISAHLDSVADKQNLLVQVAQTHEEHITQLEHDLSLLSDVLEAFIKYNPTLLYARLNHQVDTLEDRVLTLLDTIQQLQHHRLSIRLLTQPQLAAMHADIQASAASMNAVPFPQNLQDYFQLETSYLNTGSEILILLHVPCSTNDDLLTIYKYIPFPFPILPLPPSDTVSLSTIQDLINLDFPAAGPASMEGLTFNTDQDLIAIGKNKNNRAQYILLSSTDLDACYRRSHTYICEKHQVIRSDITGSCLGALYVQHPEGVKENCRIDRRPLRETVYQLTATDHLVFTPAPLTTQITCRNGSHFPLKIRSTMRISLPEGCTIELANHTIQSDFSLRIAPEALHFEWEFNPALLPNSAQLLQGTKHIDPQLRQIRKHLERLATQTISEEQFANMMVAHITSPNTYSIVIWVILAILGTALAIAAASCLWIRRRNKFPQHHEHMNDQMNGNMHEHLQNVHLLEPLAPQLPHNPHIRF